MGTAQPTAIVQILVGALQPDQSLRLASEAQLEEFKRTQPEFAQILASVALAEDVDLPIRKLALVILKRYIASNWSAKTENFVGPEPPLNVKHHVKHSLLEFGLQDANQGIRVVSASVVSKVAHIEWPEDWPEFLPSLLTKLQRHEPHLIHGALCVLSALVQEDLTAQHLPEISNIILPQVLAAYTAPDLPHSMRNLSAAIFKDVVELLYNLNEEYPEVSQFLQSILPCWMDAFFKQALQQMAIVRGQDQEIDEDGTAHALRAKSHALRAINFLVMAFPKEMRQFLRPSFDLVWRDLTVLASVPREQLEIVDEDEDGDAVSGESFIFVCVDFLHRLVGKEKFRKVLFDEAAFESLVPILASFMVLTEDRVEGWQSDINAYISDEIEGDSCFSLRASCADLVHGILEHSGEKVVPALRQACMRHLEANLSYWYKVEAMLNLLSLCCEGIQHPQSFLETLLSFPIVQQHEMVQAQLIRIMGKMSEFLSADFVAKCADYCLSHLTSARPILLVCAMRSLENFIHLAKLPVEKFQEPMIRAIEILLGGAHGESLLFLLQALVTSLSIEPQKAASCVGFITPKLLTVWLQHAGDPIVCDMIAEIVEAMALSQDGLNMIVAVPSPSEGSVSVLSALMEALSSQDIDQGIHASSIEIISRLLRQSQRLGCPLQGEHILRLTYARLMHVLVSSDDATALQQGQNCLRTIVQNHMNFLIESESGMHPIIQFIARMLQPDQSESRALYVGDLIQVLIQKGGNVLAPLLPDLLAAVVNRLALAQLPSFIQRLVMIFVLLLNSPQYEDTIQFLTTCPLPPCEFQDGLSIFFARWTENHMFFIGKDIKLSIYVLSQIFAKADPRLKEIRVPGDVPAGQGDAHPNRRVTRSSKAKAKNTTIPLFGRILQLLTDDLVQSDSFLGAEGRRGRRDEVDDCDDEDEDGWEAEGSSAYLSDMLEDDIDGGSDRYDGQEQDENTDPENAWLSEFQVQSYLKSFFSSTISQGGDDLKSYFSLYLRPDQTTVLHQVCRPA